MHIFSFKYALKWKFPAEITSLIFFFVIIIIIGSILFARDNNLTDEDHTQFYVWSEFLTTGSMGKQQALLI